MPPQHLVRPKGDGVGVDIYPGAVVVDLTVVHPSSLTSDDLAEAFEDASAQLRDEETPLLDDIGDLDMSPL